MPDCFTVPSRCRVAPAWNIADRPPDAVLVRVIPKPCPCREVVALCRRRRPPIPGLYHSGAYLDPDRLKKPLMRKTIDGRQTFVEVEWDEALDFVADRMKSIAATHGPAKMLMLNHGAGSSHFRHLLRAYGSDSHAEPAFAQCRGPLAADESRPDDCDVQRRTHGTPDRGSIFLYPWVDPDLCSSTCL